MGPMEVVGLLLLFAISIAPIIVAHKIGKPKNRLGWVWGLLLGWIGVIIVACLSPAPTPEQREVNELEQQLRIQKLRKELELI